jgi:hypothetical protein
MLKLGYFLPFSFPPFPSHLSFSPSLCLCWRILDFSLITSEPAISCERRQGEWNQCRASQKVIVSEKLCRWQIQFHSLNVEYILYKNGSPLSHCAGKTKGNVNCFNHPQLWRCCQRFNRIEIHAYPKKRSRAPSHNLFCDWEFQETM